MGKSRRSSLPGRSYWFRDLKGKAVRRARKLIGRADNSPWVLRPAAGSRSGDRYVDFIIGIDFLGNNATLTKMFHRGLSPYGLSLLIANKHNVHKLTDDARRGRLRPYVYLDLCSAIEPVFGELLRAMHAAGVHTIGQPEKLDKWTHKARAQQSLEEAGLPVPPTVVIRAADPSRDLTADELRHVGEKCVIKPSWGVAGKGVLANVRPTAQNIETARQFEPKDDYLVQKMIRWESFGPRTAYVRGYNVLGHRTLLWWAPETKLYDLLTWDDFRRHDLLGAVEIIDRMAAVTGMDFFSSEIAITNGVGQPRFIIIDYCNDQCDMNPVSEQADGPPDAWSAWVVQRFAEFVWKKKHAVPETGGHSLWLTGETASGSARGTQIVTAA
jgi:hypothetical protein